MNDEPQSAGLDLDELEGLHWNATPTPWKVLEKPNPSNGTFEAKHPGKNLTEPTERTIATEFDHPQLKRPAQIISQGYTPYFERSPFLHITPEDARYIVAACNAVPQLVGALRQAEAENAALRGERDRLREVVDVAHTWHAVRTELAGRKRDREWFEKERAAANRLYKALLRETDQRAALDPQLEAK